MTRIIGWVKIGFRSDILSAWVIALVFVLGASAGLLSGCTRDSAPKTRTVNLAIWSHYVSPESIAIFEKQTGIRVQISNYSSNEELLAKLQAGASGYDVAVPSDYMVFVMAKLGLLVPIDLAKASGGEGQKRFDPRTLAKSFDPTNTVSVPYGWGTTGIAVNRTKFLGKVSGWKDLFRDPAMAGKFSLLDDAREAMGAALKSMGKSLNSVEAADLEQVKAVLLQARTRVKSFTSETKMPLITGEIAVAHAYSIDAFQAAREGRTRGQKIDFVLPEEGGTLWIDNLVIPKGAPNVEAAHELIAFLTSETAARETMNRILVAPSNKAALVNRGPELLAFESLVPAPERLGRFEMIQDLGEQVKDWDRVWTEVKASR